MLYQLNLFRIPLYFTEHSSHSTRELGTMSPNEYQNYDVLFTVNMVKKHKYAKI